MLLQYNQRNFFHQIVNVDKYELVLKPQGGKQFGCLSMKLDLQHQYHATSAK